MIFKSFLKLKDRLKEHRYDERQLIFLFSMPIVAFFIWGSYNDNLYRIYNSVHSSISSPLVVSSTQAQGKSIYLPSSQSVLPFSLDNKSKPVKKDHSLTKIVIKPVVLGPSQTDASFTTYPSWSQDFASSNSSKIDSKVWNVNIGPADNSNSEAEYYTNNSTNLHFSDGALDLEATQQSEPDGYSYGSARIDTQNKQSFLYGRIDITAKVPIGAGIWPAAWLLPDNSKYENLSPSSDSSRYVNGGEIDLIEEVGFLPNIEYGIVHSESDLTNPNGVGEFSTVSVPNGSTNYNLYSLLWTPTTITFEVNNIPFYTYAKTPGANFTTWPFDQPFYLILNLAIGGSWGGEDKSQFPGNGIDNSALPSSFDIQSIYYYPYIGS